MRLTLAYTALLTLIAVPAMACEAPLYDPKWRDKPIDVAPDCSFKQADEFPGQHISASRAQNVGDGQLGQVVSTYQACGLYQSLLFVDCTSGEALLIDAPEGNPPVSFGGAPNREIRDLYAPEGKLRLTTSSDIAQLVAQARKYGYDHTTDVAGRLSSWKKRNRYNPFCGCKLFYPESTGAEMAKKRG